MKNPLRISMGLLSLLLSAVLAASLWMIVSELYGRQQEQNTFDQLTLLVMPSEPEESVASVPTGLPTATIGTDSTEPELDERNIAPLFEQNRDCIGWLSIPGTNLDYPVMHTPEVPLKYLRRDFFGNRSQSGVPFLDWRCNLTDYNLIVYGHNMKNVVISTLKSIVSESDNRQNRMIFKLAVELAIVQNLLASMQEVDPVSMERLRAECVKEVKRLNGSFAFEDALTWQQG